jgi:hypothetical protein
MDWKSQPRTDTLCLDHIQHVNASTCFSSTANRSAMDIKPITVMNPRSKTSHRGKSRANRSMCTPWATSRDFAMMGVANGHNTITWHSGRQS